MTSTLVKNAPKTHYDVSSLVNFVEKQEKPTDFSGIMLKAAGRAGENVSAPNRENLLRTTRMQAEKPHDEMRKASTAEAKTAEAITTEVPKEPEKANPVKTDDPQISEKTEAVSMAASEVVSTIADQFQLTPEEVIEILNALGMIPESLLDPAALSEVVIALEGCDLLTLMTDEVLYENFTALTAEIQPIINELLQETDLTPEEMKMLIEQLKTAESQEEPLATPERLTESVNQTNELAAQQNTEPEARITVTVERDGVITEVTAKADENGNVKATTDVAEINTAPKVVVENAEPPKQSGSESQNNQRSTEGYEAILNNLLQNRVNTVEAKFEPIILETPDTQQILNQILDFMKVKLTPEIDSLEMQLHPASLGTVSVKITSTAGVIAAQFTAQNETVRTAIESQLVELKENMRAQGIKVDTIEVNVKSQEFNSQLWQGKDESSENEQGNRKNRRRINLSGLDELPEELIGDEKLAAEMMIENGQTVDFSA